MAQVQIATDAQFGIGLQSAYGKLQGRNQDFRYYSATNLPYGPNQPIQNLPPELGRSIVPRGQFKQGIWGAGNVGMIPRFWDDFGQLLLSALGEATVTADTKFSDSDFSSTHCVDESQTDSNIHTFTFQTQEAILPYFTTRRVLPNQVEASMLGEIIQDNRVGGLEITLPAAGPMSATMDMMGRIPEGHNVHKSDPTYDWRLETVDYDNDDAFGLGVHTDSFITIRMGDEHVQLPITGLVATLTNTLLPPDQSRIVGSPTPEDYPVLARVCLFRATVLLTDYEICRRIINFENDRADNAFDPRVYEGDINVVCYSPLKFAAGATELEYAFQIKSTDDNISWALQGPVPLTPQQPVALTLIGTAQRQEVGDYIQFRLQSNITTAYTQPSTSGYWLDIRPDLAGAVVVGGADGLYDEPEPRMFSAGSLVEITAPDSVAATEPAFLARLACQNDGDVPIGTYTYQVVVDDGTNSHIVAESNSVSVTDPTENGKVMLTGLPVIGNWNRITGEITAYLDGTGTLLATSDHTYAVSFLYTDGTEGSDVYISNTVETGATDQITFDLPIGGSSVVGRRIYVKVEAVDYIPVVDIADNTTASYTHNAPSVEAATAKSKTLTYTREVYRDDGGGFDLIEDIADDTQTWYLDNTETPGAPSTASLPAYDGLLQDDAVSTDDGGTLTDATQFTYRFTYLYEDASESNWVVEMTATTGTNSIITLSNIPVGPVDVAKRRIYQKEGAGAFALLDTLDDNETATYIDDGSVSPVTTVTPPTDPMGKVGDPSTFKMNNTGIIVTAQFT